MLLDGSYRYLNQPSSTLINFKIIRGKMKLSFEIPRRVDGGIEQRRISDEMFNEICLLTPWVEDTSRKSLRERCYCIVHNISEPPKCENCSEKTKFSVSNNIYSKACSNECKIIIRKQTCLEKYGVEHVSQVQEVKDKIKKINLERFGVEYYFQSADIREKSKQTCQERYGVENPAQSEEIKEKTRQTNLEKYGVDNPWKSEKVKEKIKATNLEKYGVDNPWKSEKVKEKIKATNLEKYGSERPIQSQETKDKISISLANNFQARRNNEGTDYSGVVYILHFPQHSAVKIGLAEDFLVRSKRLIKDFGEFSIIDIIETESVFALETSLHQKFSDHSLCLDEGTGRTEFFSDEILKL
jgi:hypothetical protein